MTWSKLKDEFKIDDIGGRLLANLAKGIYTHEAVLREYVQNAADAYQQLGVVDNPTITITVEDGNTLTVHDKGVGMDEKAIREAKRIAVSSKADMGLTGFRGIGIWAGFQACDRLVILTTKKGDTRRYRLTIDFNEILKHVDDDINIKKLLDNRFHLEVDQAEKKEHYTEVKLEGIHSEYAKLLDEEELCRIVAQNLPCRIDPNFRFRLKLEEFLQSSEGYQELRILVGKNEVVKTFPDGIEQIEFDTLRDEGIELAKVWWASGKGTFKTQFGQHRGFSLRVRNFAVGGPGMYNDEHGSRYGLQDTAPLKTVQRLNRYSGEIFITHHEIVPDTPRSGLELTTQARRVIEKIRAFYRQRIAEAGSVSDVNAAQKHVKDAREMLEPGPFDIDKAKGFLRKLQNGESRLKRTSPGRAATAGRLTNQAKFNKEYRETAKQLAEKIAAAENKPHGRKKGTSAGKAEALDLFSPAREPEFERLLSEILAIIDSKLDDDELVTEISAELQELFERHRFITAGEGELL
jgi:hypothetical protein